MANLSDEDEARLYGEAIFPAIIALLYGIYKFFTLGLSFENYLYTYIVVAGAVLTIVSTGLYISSMSSKQGRSAINMMKAFTGLIPYAFSLYLFGFFGVYSLWMLLSNFSFTLLLFGLFWTIVGYRLLYKFWTITEISVSELQ